MFKKLKITIQKLLNKDVSELEAPASKQHKAIARIQKLRQQLDALTRGYDKAIDGLKATYNSKLSQFEKQYRLYQDKHKQYRKMMLTEDDIKQSEKELQPYKVALEDAGAELNKVEGFKKEEVMQIINEIEALKEEYLSALAEEIKQDASALAQHKQEYLQKVSFIGKAYSDVAETDDMMQLHLQNNGLSYQKDKLKHTLELHTSDITIDMLTITPEEVADAMGGTTEYKL